MIYRRSGPETIHLRKASLVSRSAALALRALRVTLGDVLHTRESYHVHQATIRLTARRWRWCKRLAWVPDIFTTCCLQFSTSNPFTVEVVDDHDMTLDLL